MADSYDRPYSSARAGTLGHKQDTPTHERIVIQKRFDPHERLEVNTKKVEKRKEVAAQVEIIREEIRSRSMPFSKMTPTIIDPKEKSVRRCRCFRQQQRLDDLPLTHSRYAETPLSPIEENQNRIVMPNRLNPRLKLEMKQEIEKQTLKEMKIQNQQPPEAYPGDYSRESTYKNIQPQHPPGEGSMTIQNVFTPKGSRPTIDDHQQFPTVRRLLPEYDNKQVLARWSNASEDFQRLTQKDESENPSHEKPKPSLAPKKPARQRRPGQGSVVDSTLAHQAIPEDTQLRRNSTISLSVRHVTPSDKKYSSLHLKTPQRGSDPLHGLSSTTEPQQTPWDPFCVSARVFGLDSNTYRDFLGDKGATLVMFYDPTKSSCVKAKNNFVKAAESINRENAAFAAVNCSVEESLCFNEGITNLPSYKLYSQGNLINIVKDTFFFNDRAMKKFVEKAPALAQEGLVKPSCKSGKTLLKKAIEKIKRHK